MRRRPISRSAARRICAAARSRCGASERGGCQATRAFASTTLLRRATDGLRRTRSSRSSTTTCRFWSNSVSAAINERDGVVRLVIHPVIVVARDSDGNLVGLDPGERGQRESWMQIEITREPDAVERSALAEALAAVLADVRAAVTDWPRDARGAGRDVFWAERDGGGAAGGRARRGCRVPPLARRRQFRVSRCTRLCLRRRRRAPAARGAARGELPRLRRLARCGGAASRCARFRSPPRTIDHQQDRPPLDGASPGADGRDRGAALRRRRGGQRPYADRRSLRLVRLRRRGAQCAAAPAEDRRDRRAQRPFSGGP